MSKIVDCFPFFNELDLLEIRLATLYDRVDKFVITEARQSHAGKPKPLFLAENLDRFSMYEDKLILQVVENFPPNVKLFEADWYQREQAKLILDDLMEDSDVLLYGDVDEIPRPSAIVRSVRALNDENVLVAHLAQDLFYYYVNMREESGRLLSYMGEYPGITDKKWLGTTANRWGNIKNSKLTDLRNPERKAYGVRIDNGGWHYSWVGGPDKQPALERVAKKLANTAHQEFASKRNLRKLEKRISKGQDLINRRGARFKKLEDLGSLPDYVLENLIDFEHLLAP